jgi:hypothetical protein
MTSNFFSPLSFVAVFGSGIQDPGSEINIPDPQHTVIFMLNNIFLINCYCAKYNPPAKTFTQDITKVA